MDFRTVALLPLVSSPATTEFAVAENSFDNLLIFPFADLIKAATELHHILYIALIHNNGSMTHSIFFLLRLLSPSRIADLSFPVWMIYAPQEAATPNCIGFCSPLTQTRCSLVAVSPSYVITSCSPLYITPSCDTHSSPSHSLCSSVIFSIGISPASVSTSWPSAMQASSDIFPFWRSSPFTPCFSTGTLNILLADAQ